mgnify:CR=1 FL=1
MNFSTQSVGVDNTVNMFGKVQKDAKKIERARVTESIDTVEFSNKEDKSKNGKFDVSEAAKNLGKGILSPFTAMIKHPVATVGLIAGTVALTTLIPVLTPVLAVGFGAVGLYQVGKGTYDAVNNYRKGNYDEAEKSFDKIGQGIVGAAMSAVGIKQGAKVANEAKLMNKLNVKSLTPQQRTEIATNVDKSGYFSALKDNVSLLFTKNGLKSVGKQFTPSSIKARFTDFVEGFKGNRRYAVEGEEVKVKKKLTPEEFKKTPEGIRRASLSDEEIQTEVNNLYNEAFDKLGVPKEQRPNLKIEKGHERLGGSYYKGKHTLEFNPESYRVGRFEVEDVIMHEATHCKEALLRAGIPQERANQVVKEQLISRVMNGESEQVVVKGSFMGADMMTPPKMSAKMKNEFIEFAKNDLYTGEMNSDLASYSNVLDLKINPVKSNPVSNMRVVEKQQKVQPFVDKISKLIADNPDFVSQYGSEEVAVLELTRYSVSHNFRYNYFSNVKINKGSSWAPDYVKVPELSGEKLAEAEQSLIDNITTIEGNGRISGFNGVFASGKDFNQYQFSPEEVLAQKNGNNFVIEKFADKIQKMKESGTINLEEEARLNAAIEKAKLIVEYKTKGLEYYKHYTEMINNPNDKKLAEMVSALERELNVLDEQIKNISHREIEVVTRCIKYYKDVATTAIPTSAITGMLNALAENDKKVA